MPPSPQRPSGISRHRDKRDEIDRIDEGRNNQPRADQGEAERATGSKFSRQSARVACMDEPGLHPPFEPARALTKPGADRGRRLFQRRQVQRPGAVAEAREAKAEIGIFGDIEWIPTTNCLQSGTAKMVGGAPERYRHAEASQCRQQSVEEGRVFDREQACQPTDVTVVDSKGRLQAGELGFRSNKDGVSLPQLIRMWPVFGVINGDEFATCERQRKGKRLWLGARSALGDDDDLERCPFYRPPRSGNGRRIAGFQHQFDVEAIAWPVRY